jgi:hypothetical protein
MKKVRLTTLAAGLVAVAGLALLSRAPVNALPASNETHMGRPPGKHVTLVHFGISSAGYRRQLATGESATTDFVVPDQQLLVVTDIEVTFRRTSADAGETVNYYLENTGPDVPSTVIRARLQATLNGEGMGSAERQILSGIVFAGGSILQDNLPDTDTFDVATVRGYLLPEK